DALLGLGKRIGVRHRTQLASKVVPEGNVVALLGCVHSELGLRARISRSGGRLRGVGKRPYRVPVLARVQGQLAATQLAAAPALVEGVLEDVPAIADGLHAVKKPHVLLPPENR